jgi:hypothetical protein
MADLYGMASYTDSGLSPGTYYYRVSAVSSSGIEGGQSDYASATVDGSIPTPAVPTAAVTVTFSDLPQDEDINLIGPADAVSWTNNEEINFTVSESFTPVAWYVDGVSVSGAAGPTFSLSVRDYAPGSHTVTAKVGKDGKDYTKRVTFRIVE